jgi:hypothetical protein
MARHAIVNRGETEVPPPDQTILDLFCAGAWCLIAGRLGLAGTAGLAGRFPVATSIGAVMASAPPDPHPDSPPTGPEQVPEQVPLPDDDGRESVEDVPEAE